MAKRGPSQFSDSFNFSSGGLVSSAIEAAKRSREKRDERERLERIAYKMFTGKDKPKKRYK